jgi:hypothetical protein
MSGGSGAGGGIGWVGYGRGVVGAYIARRRAMRQMTAAVEADLTERGIPIPPKPLSQEKIFGIGFFCGLLKADLPKDMRILASLLKASVVAASVFAIAWIRIPRISSSLEYRT